MKLTLSEELLLLSLDDEKGNAIACSHTAFPYALSGAVLYELSASGFVEINGDDVSINSGMNSGNGVLEIALKEIGTSKKVAKVKWVISRIVRKFTEIRKQLYERLVSMQILKKDERRFLWLIPYNRYPTKNALPELTIRKRLIDAVLDECVIEERDYFLLSLIKATRLEKEVFPKEILEEAKSRLKSLSENESLGKAVRAIEKEINFAIVTMMAASAVVITTN